MTTELRIVGIDISAHFVAATLLESKPDDLLVHYRKHRDKIFKLLPNRDGITELLAMKPTHAALEPTGVNYSKIWAEILADHGVKILWVGHVNLKAHRNSNRMPNKNDYADALALAHYGLVHIDQPQYFVKFDPFSKQGDIRQLCLQLGHLNRVQSPIVNRIRQALAYEFPEIAEHCGDRKNGNVATLFRYIAGEKIATQSINRFEKLKAKSIGVGISPFTKYHAVRMCDIHRQEIEIETTLSMLTSLTSCPNFDKYNKVFDEFGFGQRVRALIISTIYPMETFLGANGKPVVEIVPNLKGTGTAKRHRSLSSFTGV